VNWPSGQVKFQSELSSSIRINRGVRQESYCMVVKHEAFWRQKNGTQIFWSNFKKKKSQEGEEGFWHVSYKCELQYCFKEPDIIVMKVARMRWIWHVIRVKEVNIQKWLLFSESWGHRWARQPKLWLLVCVTDDLPIVGAGNWRRRDKTKKNFRKLLNELWPTQGCYAATDNELN